MLSLIGETLPSLHCEIETVPSTSELLPKLKEKSFDLILTGAESDLEQDLALLRDIRAINPRVRVVVFTPSEAADGIIAAMREHVYAVFSRPFDPIEVRDLICRTFDGPAWDDGIQVMSARPDWIALRVACRLETAERVIQFMHELRTGLPDEVKTPIAMAFREILINAMEHGGGFDPSKFVEINAVCTRRALVYHLRDPGSGFAPGATEHAATLEDPVVHMEARESKGMRPGGFGILLARQLMDEVIYNEAGNEVVLIKYLDQ
ncbi:MAG: ATP-binding protein [Bryobacteraceae bacterium]|nr:ATP-binding protein [Bryobacteraceae bacterium]